MKTNILRQGKVPLLALGAALLLSAPAASHAEWVMQPVHFGSSVDLGQVVKGYSDVPLEDFSITRTGAYLSVSAIRDEKLELRIGLGGLFWYAANTGAGAEYRLMKFGSGMGEAQAIYSFGDARNPSSKLQVGFFPIKYGDSHNLGEYLYRSGTYPGYIVTGGWSYMQSAAYMGEGIRYTLPMLNGMLVHDFTLLSDRDWEPLHDLSPGYTLTVKPTGFLEAGAVVVWSHAIPARPSRVQPKTMQNAYSTNSKMPVAGAAGFGVSETVVFNTPGDPSSGVDTIIVDTTAREAQTLRDWAACEAGDCSNIDYYTFKGFKGMVRASFDVGVLLGMPQIDAGDFKLYGEVALLGFQDQPYYYDDKSERMPMMAGLNIPTFGLLDRLSAEVEYHKSRFTNSIYAVGAQGTPQPVTKEDGSAGGYAYQGRPEYTKDDWKWSFYARRSLYQGVNVHAQVASDHQRHPDFWGVMSDASITNKTTDWYYVFRVDFNL
jgi:hypothetical protein